MRELLKSNLVPRRGLLVPGLAAAEHCHPHTFRDFVNTKVLEKFESRDLRPRRILVSEEISSHRYMHNSGLYTIELVSGVSAATGF